MKSIHVLYLLVAMHLLQACCNCNGRDDEPVFTENDLSILPENKKQDLFYLVHQSDSIAMSSCYLEDEQFKKCGGIGFSKCSCPEDRTKYAYYDVIFGDIDSKRLSFSFTKKSTGLTTVISFSNTLLTIKERITSFTFGCTLVNDIYVYTLPSGVDIMIDNNPNNKVKEIWYSSEVGVVRMVDQNQNNWDLYPQCD